MAGLDPAIPINGRVARLSEMPGIKPGMTVAYGGCCLLWITGTRRGLAGSATLPSSFALPRR